MKRHPFLYMVWVKLTDGIKERRYGMWSRLDVDLQRLYKHMDDRAIAELKGMVDAEKHLIRSTCKLHHTISHQCYASSVVPGWWML